MDEIIKSAIVAKGEVAEGELELINQQSLATLAADSVYTFKLAACDNQVDRDMERFTDQALEDMARLFVGRPVLLDHQWSATRQTARVYAAAVEDTGDGVKRLVLRCYMLRSAATQPAIDAIEGGILREVSVGLAVSKTTCSICGQDYFASSCFHRRGLEYDGKPCHIDLDGVTDVYEVSFVAVPAQREAGVIKRYKAKETEDPKDETQGEDPPDDKLRRAKARLELEKIRYGGN